MREREREKGEWKVRVYPSEDMGCLWAGQQSVCLVMQK